MTTSYPEPFADALLAQTSWLRGLARTLVEDTAGIDDVCQATLLEAWRYRPRHGPRHDASLRPWLASVARHVAGRLSRRERQRPGREAEAARPEAGRAAAEVVAQVAWQQTVVGAVMRLDEPYRATILLRFWDDLPPREVARRMDVPVETVRTRLKRGLALLRATLDREKGRQAWFTALLPLATGGAAALPLTAAVIVMSKKTALAGAAILGGLALTTLLWPDAPPPGPGLPATTNQVAETPPATAPDPATAPSPELRVAAAPTATSATEPGVDPAIEAALCGFRGRLVDAANRPVPATGVRIYRQAFDHVLAPDVDLLGKAGQGPDLMRKLADTDAGGRFLIDGVWPRGLYVLVAESSDRGRVMRVLDAAPRPGEIVDLGDVRLDAGGVLRGTVVDADGAPVVGARVRAIDLPGSYFAALPLDRFDPAGALLLRTPVLGTPVVALPAWVATLFAQLPIPETHSDAAGHFRLHGVPTGDNVVAVTDPERLSVVLPRVSVREGIERDLGQLRQRMGESLRGRVVDAAGLPVAGAEILAAPTSSLAPVDLATRLAPTDQSGAFRGAGFPPGRVTLAVRRGPGHAWILQDPQPVLREIEITLPAVCALALHVTTTTGEGAADVRVELLRGDADPAAIRMRMLGLLDPIRLRGRLHQEAATHWRISDLEPGRYLVAVASPGHATALHPVELPCEPVEVVLQPVQPLTVRVVDSRGRGVRQASVFVRPRDDADPRAAMPVHRGHTDAGGSLQIEGGASALHVIANHPAHGTVTALAEADDTEITLVMEQTGGIHGRVVEDGAVPEAGRYSVLLTAASTPERDILEASPSLARVGPDGGFAFADVQPGEYLITLSASLATATSIGKMVAVTANQRIVHTAHVTVRAGAVSKTRIVVGDVYTEEGVSARVHGTVMIDGAPGGGLLVALHTDGGPEAELTTVNADGWFDTGTIAAGHYQLSVHEVDGERRTLHRSRHDFLGGEERVDIAIQSSSLSGTVLAEDGSAVVGATVELMGTSLDGAGLLEFRARTDRAGAFSLTRLPAGRYRVLVRHAERKLFAAARTVELRAGSPESGFALIARRMLSMRGTVGMTGAERAAAGKITLTLRREDRISEHTRVLLEVASVVVTPDGAFLFEGLASGGYQIEAVTESGRELVHDGLIELGERDLEGLVLELVAR